MALKREKPGMNRAFQAVSAVRGTARTNRNRLRPHPSKPQDSVSSRLSMLKDIRGVRAQVGPCFWAGVRVGERTVGAEPTKRVVKRESSDLSVERVTLKSDRNRRGSTRSRSEAMMAGCRLHEDSPTLRVSSRARCCHVSSGKGTCLCVRAPSPARLSGEDDGTKDIHVSTV